MKNSLPVYRIIAEDLAKMIRQQKLPPDTRLPSESQLAGQYQVTRMTVRKGLDLLQGQGLIYSRHGQGIFVASGQRKRPVIITGTWDDQTMPLEIFPNDTRTFCLSAIETAAELPYEIFHLPFAGFHSMLNELNLRYPDLAGVVFFRSFPNVLATKDELNKQRIPFLYFGSNQFTESTGYNTLYCDETEMMKALVGRLKEMGKRRLGWIHFCNKRPFMRYRYQCWRKAMEHHRFPVLPESVMEFDDFESFRQQLNSAKADSLPFDAVCLSTGPEATWAFQLLARFPVSVGCIDNPYYDEIIGIDLCAGENGGRAIELLHQLTQCSTETISEPAVFRLTQ